MGKYFGTDGFRGEANVNLTVEHAYKVGRFLGWYYGKNHEDGKAKVVIGKSLPRLRSRRPLRSPSPRPPRCGQKILTAVL